MRTTRTDKTEIVLDPETIAQKTFQVQARLAC